MIAKQFREACVARIDVVPEQPIPAVDTNLRRNVPLGVVLVAADVGEVDGVAGQDNEVRVEITQRVADQSVSGRVMVRRLRIAKDHSYSSLVRVASLQVAVDRRDVNGRSDKLGRHLALEVQLELVARVARVAPAIDNHSGIVPLVRVEAHLEHELPGVGDLLAWRRDDGGLVLADPGVRNFLGPIAAARATLAVEVVAQRGLRNSDGRCCSPTAATCFDQPTRFVDQFLLGGHSDTPLSWTRGRPPTPRRMQLVRGRAYPASASAANLDRKCDASAGRKLRSWRPAFSFPIPPYRGNWGKVEKSLCFIGVSLGTFGPLALHKSDRLSSWQIKKRPMICA